MTSLRFEYYDTISINALTLICLGHTEFDHHTRGLQMHEGVLRVVRDILKADPDKAQKVVWSDDSTISNRIKPRQNEFDAIVKLNDVRNDIKAAIKANALTIDELDTKDCNEIRLDYQQSLEWIEESYSKIVASDYKEIPQADNKENLLATIAGLFDLIRLDSKGKVNEDITPHNIANQINKYLLETHDIDKGVSTIEKQLKSACNFLVKSSKSSNNLN